ncbi:hypothetical protein KKC22_02350 [Myxococcota bacterium]|nr:hypothetical protein [Myxococcota bacterium]
MKKTISLILLVSCSVLFMSCGTIMGISSPDLTIRSAPGVTVLVDGKKVGITDARGQLKLSSVSRRNSHNLTFKKENCLEESRNLSSKVNKTALWVDIFLTLGVVGIAIDYLTGYLFELSPDDLYADLFEKQNFGGYSFYRPLSMALSQVTAVHHENDKKNIIVMEVADARPLADLERDAIALFSGKLKSSFTIGTVSLSHVYTFKDSVSMNRDNLLIQKLTFTDAKMTYDGPKYLIYLVRSPTGRTLLFRFFASPGSFTAFGAVNTTVPDKIISTLAFN